MSRLSNSTLRATRILDYLVAYPGQSTGLSALARSLDINKSTCLSILRSLALMGYVTEDPQSKEYTLGPSLLAAHAVGRARWDGLEPALEASRTLSDRLGVCADVQVRVGGHYTVVDRAGPLPGPLQSVSWIGLRIPFVAPMGVSFVSWSTPVQFETWLRPWMEADGHPSPLAAPVLRQFVSNLEACIEACRQRGYSIEVKTPGLRDFLKEAMAQMQYPDYDHFVRRAMQIVCSEEMVDYPRAEIAGGTRVSLSSVTSPITSADGTAAIALSLFGFEAPVSGTRVYDLGAELAAETRKISTELGARPAPTKRER